MAKHLPPSKKKEIKLPEIKLPVAKLAALKRALLSVTSDEADEVGHGIQQRRAANAVSTPGEALPLAAALIAFIAALMKRTGSLADLLLYIAACVLALAPALLRIVSAALKKRLRERDTLILLAVVGALAIGEHQAAALAAILYRAGELLEGLAIAYGKRAVVGLRGHMPARADVEEAAGVSSIVPQEIAVGDILSVMPGEEIPVDSQVIEGESTVDASFLTGSTEPRGVSVGDTVLSGCVNLKQTIRVKALRLAVDSAAERLMETVETAPTNRSEREKSVSRFTGATSFGIFALGLVIGLVPPIFKGDWLEWLRRGISLIVLAMPTGMLISMPLTYFGGVLLCAHNGVSVKGTRFIESMAKVKTMVFEKNGTVTERKCSVLQVCPKGVSEQELLGLAALAENGSSHPFAQALRAAAAKAGAEEGTADETLRVEETECRGVSAFAGGRHVYVGNAALMNEHGIGCDVPRRKGTAVHVASDGQYLGYILLSSRIKENAFDSLEAIRHGGVENMVMLTGDLHSATRPVASSLNFDMVKTELNRDGKLTALEYLMAAKPERSTLAFVGDGTKDGELFKRADVGIALGAAETALPMEEADVIVMGDDLKNLAEAMSIARMTDRAAQINALATLAIRMTGIVLCLVGVLPLILAVLAEAGATLFSLVSTLRIYIGVNVKKRRKKKSKRDK